MVKKFKKIGAVVLAGAITMSVASVLINPDNDSDNENVISSITESFMSAHESNIENTVVADVENSEPMAVPAEKQVRYSTLGC